MLSSSPSCSETDFSKKTLANLEATLALLKNIGQSGFDPANSWARAACLLIIALKPQIKAYQLLESLPLKSPMSKKKDFDQVDFLNTLAHVGYTAHNVSIDINHVDQRLLPCLFIGKRHEIFILIKEKNKDGITFYDAKKHEILNKDCKPISGTCYIFKPYDIIKNPLSLFMRSSTGHGWFRSMISRFSSSFRQIIVSGIFLNVIGLATPLYTMAVYDRVIGIGASDMMMSLTVGVVLALIFEWMLRRVRSQGLSWIATRMDNLVGNAIFQQMVHLSADLIERASVAAQISRMKTFEAIRDFFSSTAFMSLLDMPFVIIAACTIYFLAGPLILIPLSALALYAVLFYVMHKKIKMAIRLAAKASSARQQFSIDAFEKINAVRAYGLSSMWQQTYRDLSGREMMAHFHLNFLGQVSETIAHVLTMIAAIGTLTFGVNMVWAGSITTGGLLATMMLVWRVLTPFYSLCTVLPRLEQLYQSVFQINQLMEIKTENQENNAMASLSKLQGQLRFAHLSYRHGDKEDMIIDNFSHMLQSGDLTVITGDNGSGKTTLLKLIKGVYRPESGAILIDGFDLRQLDATELRRQIAYVPQQADIFNGTIIENLRLANPLASLNDIREALELADALEEIEAMPQAMQTPLSRYGLNSISSNNLLTFKIILARAYLQPSPLLLIDELPNNLLISRAGKNLKDYLVRNKGKRSVIMVTYREDFMAISDQIITLRRQEKPITVNEKYINTDINETFKSVENKTVQPQEAA